MSRAQQLIEKLNEAGGLEPSDVSGMKMATKGRQHKPGGGGKLTSSPGFNYGSAGKKTPDMEDSEIEDNDVDSPVLAGNMFKRDASQDAPSANKRKPVLTPMTGLKG